MAEQPAQTTVKMTLKGWKLEVSVNMEEVPLRIYEETEEENRTVCWIASEVGKNYSVTMLAKRSGILEDAFFDNIEARVVIDGQECYATWLSRCSHALTVGETRIDATHVREWQFSQPRLDEDDGRSKKNVNQDLGSIVVQLRRARQGVQVKRTYQKPQQPGPISEKAKKGVLGAVTTFGKTKSAVPERYTTNESIRKPQDEVIPLWTFRFNYATEAILQAQGRIPLKHNIKRGEPGLTEAAPIDLEEDEPRPSVRSSNRKKPATGNKARTGLLAQEAALDAMEDALSAELAKIRAKKRKLFLSSLEHSDEEDDSKGAVKRHMSHMLHTKKARDGGKVDLTRRSE